MCPSSCDTDPRNQGVQQGMALEIENLRIGIATCYPNPECKSTHGTINMELLGRMLRRGEDDRHHDGIDNKELAGAARFFRQSLAVNMVLAFGFLGEL